MGKEDNLCVASLAKLEWLISTLMFCLYFVLQVLHAICTLSRVTKVEEVLKKEECRRRCTQLKKSFLFVIVAPQKAINSFKISQLLQQAALLRND